MIESVMLKQRRMSRTSVGSGIRMTSTRLTKAMGNTMPRFSRSLMNRGLEAMVAMGSVHRARWGPHGDQLFAGQFVDVGEDFCDGGVEFLGDFFADFDHAIDGARQGRAFDDRDAGFRSQMADANRHEVDALGDD